MSRESVHIYTGRSVIKNVHRDYAQYRDFLKASITIPYIAGGPRTIDGKRLMDGGLLQQVALESAFEAGATHILVLQTRRQDEQIRPAFSRKIGVQASFIQFLYDGKLGEIYRHRNKLINGAIDTVRKKYGPSGQCISEISLDDSIDYIHRLTKEPEPLRQAAEIMSDVVISRFSDA